MLKNTLEFLEVCVGSLHIGVDVSLAIVGNSGM